MSGINLFLLRGLTRESGHWGSFIDLMKKELPPTAKIFLMDLPGSGIHVKKKASVSVPVMVDFMRDIHYHQLQNPDSVNIICATSLGGMLASDWVIRYPFDFNGLVIINSSFKYICKNSERIHKRVRLDMVKILFSRTIEKREALIIKVNSNKPELYQDLCKDWSKIQYERKMTRMNIFRQSIAGYFYGLKNEKPTIPLLIIGSKGDRMVCPECIDKIHIAFGGTLLWHPTSGHGLPIDDPKWLSEQVGNWCKKTF